jgi:solute carrier family 8 (sodium/calcium exchanger)
MTAFIGEMASLLGCCIGIPNEICAITLVALGTSLPDTFASKISAVQEDTADNSVGNVTGSNSVNVFLGLGMPWTMGAIYWNNGGVTDDWLDKRYKGSTYRKEFLSMYPEGGFLVPAGSLGMSVAVFAVTAVLCVMILIYRRKKYGAELGGPDGSKRLHSIFMCFLWFAFIGASCMIFALG